MKKDGDRKEKWALNFGNDFSLGLESDSEVFIWSLLKKKWDYDFSWTLDFERCDTFFWDGYFLHLLVHLIFKLKK